MLSLTDEITTALSHTDELISPPYDIAIVTISYGRVTRMRYHDVEKNMGWPFYAAVLIDAGLGLLSKMVIWCGLYPIVSHISNRFVARSLHIQPILVRILFPIRYSKRLKWNALVTTIQTRYLHYVASTAVPFLVFVTRLPLRLQFLKYIRQKHQM